MKLLHFSETNMSDFEPAAKGKIFSLALEISDLENRVEEMLEIALDTSWLDPLGVIDKPGYKARSKKTIDKITNDILKNVGSEMSEEFGEYMVSDAAQTALKEHLKHLRLPLAEFIKEKISGNPGFDFHTECTSATIAFGEAKYSGVSSAHGRALKQINEFIIDEKDIQELPDLQKFVTKAAAMNAVYGTKSYSAAFSITSNNINKIMDNALNSPRMKSCSGQLQPDTFLKEFSYSTGD